MVYSKIPKLIFFFFFLIVLHIVCAFHLKYDDIPLDQNVAKWAVNVISLSRTKRHSDRAELMTFWEKIDR